MASPSITRSACAGPVCARTGPPASHARTARATTTSRRMRHAASVACVTAPAAGAFSSTPISCTSAAAWHWSKRRRQGGATRVALHRPTGDPGVWVLILRRRWPTSAWASRRPCSRCAAYRRPWRRMPTARRSVRAGGGFFAWVRVAGRSTGGSRAAGEAGRAEPRDLVQ